MSDCKTVEFPSQKPVIRTVADLRAAVTALVQNKMPEDVAQRHLKTLDRACDDFDTYVGIAEDNAPVELIGTAPQRVLRTITSTYEPCASVTERRRSMLLVQHHATAFGCDLDSPAAVWARILGFFPKKREMVNNAISSTLPFDSQIISSFLDWLRDQREDGETEK